MGIPLPSIGCLTAYADGRVAFESLVRDPSVRAYADAMPRWALRRWPRAAPLYGEDDLHAMLLAEVDRAVRRYRWRCGRCPASLASAPALVEHGVAAHGRAERPVPGIDRYVHYRVGCALVGALRREGSVRRGGRRVHPPERLPIEVAPVPASRGREAEVLLALRRALARVGDGSRCALRAAFDEQWP